MKTISKTLGALIHDEDGAALTEYIVLLGLLIGGVIVAVTAFGTQLGATWTGWATWVSTAVTAPAAN